MDGDRNIFKDMGSRSSIVVHMFSSLNGQRQLNCTTKMKLDNQ